MGWGKACLPPAAQISFCLSRVAFSLAPFPGTHAGGIMTPRMLINPDSAAAWTAELRAGATTVGRDPGNDIVLAHDSVADFHARLVWEDGRVRLEDLGTGRGTLVDLQPVREARLRHGHVLRLGAVELRLELTAPTAPPAEPALLPPVSSAPLRFRPAADSSAYPSPMAGANPASSPPSPPLPAPPIPPPIRGLPARELPSLPPLPPPAPGSRAELCPRHPESVVRWHCCACGHAFCVRCVGGEGSGAGGADFQPACPECGAAGERPPAPLPVPRPAGRPAERDFLPSVGASFAYPLHGDGMILIIAGTLFYMLIGGRMLSFGALFGFAGLVVGIFGSGYLLAYLQAIITSTAAGDETLPDWPDFSGWSDVLEPLWQGVVLVAGCGLPAALVFFFARPLGDAAWFLALAAGAFYLPMAFTAVTLFGTLGAMDPRLVVRSIARVPGEYTLVCGFLVLTFLVRAGLERALADLHVPFVSSFLEGLTGMYLLTVQVRVLGVFYRTRRRALGWFLERP